MIKFNYAGVGCDKKKKTEKLFTYTTIQTDRQTHTHIHTRDSWASTQLYLCVNFFNSYLRNVHRDFMIS